MNNNISKEISEIINCCPPDIIVITPRRRDEESKLKKIFIKKNGEKKTIIKEGDPKNIWEIAKQEIAGMNKKTFPKLAQKSYYFKRVTGWE